MIAPTRKASTCALYFSDIIAGVSILGGIAIAYLILFCCTPEGQAWMKGVGSK